MLAKLCPSDGCCPTFLMNYKWEMMLNHIGFLVPSGRLVEKLLMPLSPVSTCVFDFIYSKRFFFLFWVHLELTRKRQTPKPKFLTWTDARSHPLIEGIYCSWFKVAIHRHNIYSNVLSLQRSRPFYSSDIQCIIDLCTFGVVD